ncbi:MAG: carboxypeptidase-like regulatory domain-containing protein [Chitinophagales bacterium]
MKKALNNLLVSLCLLGILNTSCTKENIEGAEVNTSQNGVITAAKASLSHLSISNDDDDFTDILINDSTGQPVMGLTVTIVDVNNPSISYTAISNSSGWASFGEVVEGTYSLTITNNGVVISVETLITLSRNDFEVVLEN